jgi:hypothetical protein
VVVSSDCFGNDLLRLLKSSWGKLPKRALEKMPLNGARCRLVNNESGETQRGWAAAKEDKGWKESPAGRLLRTHK